MVVFASLALATVILLASALPMAAQWSTVAQIPPAGRYDDVFFLDAQNGWTVNSEGFVYHTTDGGTLWDPMAFLPSYLRCVEFISPLEGFCGGLNGTFYHTNDGGANWTDIAPNIQPTIEGICGLSAPTPDVIYGCGIWSSPAYVIRSNDGGNSWDHIDLSAQASALVDIHFLSEDTGFVSGKGPGPDEEGIILYTTDGGQNWTEVYSTGVPYEYVWKLQSPDSGAHLFASIQANPNQGDTRFVRSLDRGASWTDTIISNLYYYVQAIGFLTPQLGWTGGDNALLETTDGGTTWDPIYIGQGFNRFFRINDSTAFLTGQRLYHYTADLPTAMAEKVARNIGALVAPAIAYGYKSQQKSGGGNHMPGTTSLDGATLVAALKDGCRRREIAVLEVTVDAANDGAQRFYAQHGFGYADTFILYGRSMRLYRAELTTS